MSHTTHWYTNASDWILRFSLLFSSFSLYNRNIATKPLLNSLLVIEIAILFGRKMLSSKIDQLITVLENQELDVSIQFFFIVPGTTAIIWLSIILRVLIFMNRLIVCFCFVLGNKWGYSTNIRRAIGCLFVQKRSVSWTIFCWFKFHLVINKFLIAFNRLCLRLFACSCSARFLWKRIPSNIKAGNVELEKIHNVYVCLWNNDIAGFFKIINHEWSSNVAELMFELRGS